MFEHDHPQFRLLILQGKIHVAGGRNPQVGHLSFHPDLGESPPQLILMASGTEVSIVVKAAKKLAEEGIGVRLVSFPCWELFDSQELNYQREVLPPGISARLAIEAGSSIGWHRWVGDRGVVISVDRYGASAPQKIVYEKYGLTVEQVISKAKEILV